MNINAVNKIAEFYTLSNIKNIDKKEDLQLMKISADRYENNSFQNISLSNPYGFKEMDKIVENISINQEENKEASQEENKNENQETDKKEENIDSENQEKVAEEKNTKE